MHAAWMWETNTMPVRAAQNVVAVSWLWVGRLLLVASPIAYVLFLQVNSVWSTNSGTDDPAFWVVMASGLWILAFGLGLPFFLLPTTSPSLITLDEQTLQGETVLGRRRLDVESLTSRSFEIPLNGWDWEVEVFRDASGRRLFVVRSGMWDLFGEQTVPEITQGEPLPEIVGWLAMLGWMALGVLVFMVALLPVP